MKEFYYNRRKLRNWLLISILMLIAVFGVSPAVCGNVIFGHIVRVMVFCFFWSMLYVYLWPQKLAQIDDEGIIIDKNAKLKWSDIEKKERIQSKGFCGRSFIRFKLKKKAKYRLRLMQKISATSKYGAFSIPLYAMTKQDAKAIEKEIDKHFGVASKIKNAVKSVFKKSGKSPLQAKRNKKAAK